MHAAEYQHPQAAATDEARGHAANVTLDILLDNLSLDGMPAGDLLSGEGVQSDPALTLHRARRHDRHAEAEQNGEERVGPAIDEHGASQIPPLVGAIHRLGGRVSCLGSLREVSKPEGHIRQGNEREHGAARHIGGRVSKLAFSRERQGMHGVLTRRGVSVAKGRGRRVFPGLAPHRVTWVSTSLASWPAAAALCACCRLERRGGCPRSAGQRRRRQPRCSTGTRRRSRW